jgi:hypothetical protein
MTFSIERKVVFLLAQVVLCLASLKAGAAESVDTIEEAARKSVREAEPFKPKLRAEFLRLAAVGEFPILGLSDPSDAPHADFADALAIFDIGLKPLKAFDGSMDPVKLVDQIDQVMYVVSADGKKISLAVVERQPTNEWVAVSFGDATIAPKVSHALAQSMIPPPAISSVRFLVRVPALNATFIGRRNGNSFDLTAISSNILGMAEGDTLPARTVFLSMAPIARRLNGYPT